VSITLASRLTAWAYSLHVQEGLQASSAARRRGRRFWCL